MSGRSEPPHDRQRAEREGRRGETVAALWLTCKGWQILERRARTPLGEIDIIARRGRVLAFIEVKWRRRPEDALNALHPRQQQRMLRAGALWRSRRTALTHHATRFDLICVSPGRWPRHLKGVLSAEGHKQSALI